jgi:hypothetical protein
MSDKANSITSVRVIPFTGVIFAIWAFFSPEGYGQWAGTIVRAFRTAAGF